MLQAVPGVHGAQRTPSEAQATSSTLVSMAMVPDGGDDPLDDFVESAFTHDDKTRTVFRKGSGPAVIVLAEMPGITPKVASFARRVSDAGFTVVMPHLFGVPGKQAIDDKGRSNMANMIRSLVPACVSKEFKALATRTTEPISEWLRALSRDEFERCGGLGVGAVGMCFTGGFALGMAVEDHLMAPVLSQPSLPIGFGKRKAADLHLSEADLRRVKDRCAEGDLCVLGLRFSEDRLSPGDRFQTLRTELGDNFIGVEIDSSPGNLHGFRRSAHSVLTEELRDEPGDPTHEALGQVIEFLRDRLLPG